MFSRSPPVPVTFLFVEKALSQLFVVVLTRGFVCRNALRLFKPYKYNKNNREDTVQTNERGNEERSKMKPMTRVL